MIATAINTSRSPFRQVSRTAENHTGGGSDSRWSGCQKWVIGQHGTATDDNRIDPTAQGMNPAPRFRAADPLRIASPGSNLAIKRHRPLRNHPRLPCGQQFEIGGIQRQGFRFAETHIDSNSRLTQDGRTTARDFREWVQRGDHHPRNPGLQHGLGAGGRLPEVAAGFERDIERATFC